MRKLFLVAPLLLAPVAAPAQVQEHTAPPLISVTPVTGVRVPFGANVSVFAPEGEFLVRQDRTGGALIGADAKLRLEGRWSALVGGAYSGGGAVHYFLPGSPYSAEPSWIGYTEHPFWVGKAGVSARFETPRSLGDTRRLPGTDLSAAAAFVRDFGQFHPALNFGFLGSLPLVPGLQFVLGLEDYLVFWDESRLGPAITGMIEEISEEHIHHVALRYRSSNVLQLRVGFSFSR